MLDLLLNLKLVTWALVALAVATPVAGAVAWRRVARHWRRMAVCAGLLGPWLLVLWGIHAQLIQSIGFDRIATAAILVCIAGASGLVAGWIARPRPGDFESPGLEPEEPGV